MGILNIPSHVLRWKIHVSRLFSYYFGLSFRSLAGCGKRHSLTENKNQVQVYFNQWLDTFYLGFSVLNQLNNKSTYSFPLHSSVFSYVYKNNLKFWKVNELVMIHANLNCFVWGWIWSCRITSFLSYLCVMLSNECVNLPLVSVWEFNFRCCKFFSVPFHLSLFNLKLVVNNSCFTFLRHRRTQKMSLVILWLNMES